MSAWREALLGDVIELKRGYDLPKSARGAGPFPIVSSSGISGSHSEAKVRGPGVVTGRYGTLGQVFYVTEDFWPLNTSLYVRDFKGNNARFVALLLESMELAQHDGAAAVPGLNRNQLHTVPVRVPDRPTQDRIASIVQALDDLVENNRGRVELLEEMVRAIYQEWFVRFLYPGHEDVPLVDSSLGPIPVGWRVGTVDELVTLGKETVDPSTVDPSTPAVGLEHIPRRHITLDDWGKAGSLGSRKATFRTGDVLFGKIRPYFHKVSVAPLDGICSTDAIVLRPHGEHWGQAVLALASDDFVANAVQTSNGTKMPRADWKVIREFPVAIPTAEIARRFSETAVGLLDHARTLTFQARSLASLRDLLLPTLVTGQIDVSHLDLDALTEAATA